MSRTGNNSDLKPLEYELPKAPRDMIDSWMPRLNAIAVVTGLFAATEAQLLSNLPDAGDNPSSGAGVAVAFFAYSGLFLNMGATLSSVLMIMALAALPTAARQLYIACPHGYPRSVFQNGVEHADELNKQLVRGADEAYLLSAFGLARGWDFLLRHCVLCFLGGWICVFLHIGVALWMTSSTVVAAIITPLAVLASAPPLVIYMNYMDSPHCKLCADERRTSVLLSF